MSRQIDVYHLVLISNQYANCFFTRYQNMQPLLIMSVGVSFRFSAEMGNPFVGRETQVSNVLYHIIIDRF